MVIVYCCIILHQVNTLSSRLNMDYSCASKFFLRNQIEKNNNKNKHENAYGFGL